jgi:glycosyltransferase involved in cell wall biosynthesis
MNNNAFLAGEATPLVSMIIPVYNGQSYIVDHLRCFLAQTYSNIELIIVDDGSTDDTVKIIKEEVQDSRIKVISVDHGGMSRARNAGLLECSGTYITFVDSDDFISKLYVVDLLQPLINNINCSVSIGKFSTSSVINEGAFSHSATFTAVGPREALRIMLYQERGSDVSVWGKMYKRTEVESLTFVPDLVFEDFEYTLRLFTEMTSDRKVCFVDSNVYLYIQRPNSIMHRELTKSEVDSFDYIYTSYFSKLRSLGNDEDAAFNTKILSMVSGLLSRAVLRHKSQDIVNRLDEILADLTKQESLLAKHKIKAYVIILISRFGKFGRQSILPQIYKHMKSV